MTYKIITRNAPLASADELIANISNGTQVVESTFKSRAAFLLFVKRLRSNGHTVTVTTENAEA
jgi:hypothetical protein